MVTEAGASSLTDPQTSVAAQRGRLHGLDFTRGLACLSMPIYHTIYNLYVVGLIDHRWTRHFFWETWQTLGLGTFVMVSGMAFILSTHRGIRWDRLGRRALKLGLVAALITFVTYLLMPDRFVRFGVIHFFTLTILLAPLFRPLGAWAILPGLVVIAIAMSTPHRGVYPEPMLYPLGLMSGRPRSIDYIPLIPWFGVFLLGMGLARYLPAPTSNRAAGSWMKPIIWLGKHSLPFYLIHQPVIFGVLWLIAKFVG